MVERGDTGGAGEKAGTATERSALALTPGDTQPAHSFARLRRRERERGKKESEREHAGGGNRRAAQTKK